MTGATGVVGAPLVQELVRAGRRVAALSRGPAPNGASPAVRWLRGDLQSGAYLPPLPAGDALIHTAPLWLLPDVIERLALTGARRVVAFSSTSVVTKRDSHSGKERGLAQALSAAEQATAEGCAAQGIGLTILRPTMVYGYGRDQNVTAIARFIQRYRFFVLAGPGAGLRQPVHCDDLVRACVQTLESTRTAGRAYDLSGGETLSYREMVKRIFAGLGMPPRILSVPAALLRNLLRLPSSLGLLGALTPDMADRMNQNLCFDHRAAREEFGYAPSPFLTDPTRDLRRDGGRTRGRAA